MPRRASWMLLAALATHLALQGPGSAWGAGLFVSGCAVALGACLWFVVARQVAQAAALLATWLFVFSPVAWHPGRATATALAVFVLLMTAVGAGHALHGPARKWPPRFALLAACTAVAACLQPWLCAAALVAAGAAFVYLGAGRRLWVASWLLLGLAVVAGLGAWLHPGCVAAWPALFALSSPLRHLDSWWGLLLGLAFALGLWIASPRSRFFGHTAPLLAACLLAGVFAAAPAAAVSDAPMCAVAPALLFLAGVFADGFSSKYRQWWVAAACVSCVVETADLFLITK